MDRAIELSGISTGGPFGAVIMDKTGKIIGEGHNEVTVNNDPTAHAEIVAIRRACANIDNFSLEGCTIYTSCEPCPMCLSACYWARLDKIYYANTREDAANIGRENGYNVYLVDEYKTSCMCSKCCEGKCEKFIIRKNPKPYKKGNILVHGALICKKCNAVWNRDVNGATNIFRIVKNIIDKKERHKYLCR